MTIRLPLTLAILDGMTVAVGSEVFVLPLNVVVESLQPGGDDVRTIGGGDRVLRLRGDYIPMLNLAEQYGLGSGVSACSRCATDRGGGGGKRARDASRWKSTNCSASSRS